MTASHVAATAASASAKGGDVGHAPRAGARYLDLRGGDPARRPLGGLARRLGGRDGAEPRVQSHLGGQGAAEQWVGGTTERSAFPVEERHLDGGLGFEA